MELSDEQKESLRRVAELTDGTDEEKAVIIMLTCEALGYEIEFEKLSRILTAYGLMKPCQNELDVLSLQIIKKRFDEAKELISSGVTRASLIKKAFLNNLYPKPS